MYKCENCGNVSQPRAPAQKITIETRTVSYPKREKANACWKWEKGRRRYVKIDDPGGRGRECVREIMVCPSCADILKAMPP